MKLVVTRAAQKRLRELVAFYILAYDRSYARRTVKKLNEAMLWLKEHPTAGAFETVISDGEHRRWVVGHVKLVYLVKGRTIRVTDIFDSRQDPRKMLS